jgi:hypothetical protein
MNPEDKEYLRAIYAGFAMNGLISCSEGLFDMEAVAVSSFKQADEMMLHLEPQEEGIAKARRKKVG